MSQRGGGGAVSVRVLVGDARAVLKTLPSESVHMCVTSPPYYGLRDYGVDRQIGLEQSPDEYIARMVEVFREVRRVLRKDGTAWVNMGDSYAGSGKGPSESLNKGNPHSHEAALAMGSAKYPGLKADFHNVYHQSTDVVTRPRWPKWEGVKPKDLLGIPWMLAFALRADGWYLRQDIVWSKPNPMPESVQDRPTKAHEYLFLLSKSRTYYYDADSIREENQLADTGWAKSKRILGDIHGDGQHAQGVNGTHGLTDLYSGRNKRSVWTVATEAFPEAHFATYPTALIEPCIKAGCPEDGTVLDPFFGAGTTGLVADRLNRNCIGIELNPVYAEMARRRIANESPMFCDVSIA